jgi:hypothetical protein
MNSESVGASVVKVATVTAGAAMSGMSSIQQTIGAFGQECIWFVTIAYGILQIISKIPAISDEAVALWQGVRRGNWARWWKIAGRSEKSNDGSN